MGNRIPHRFARRALHARMMGGNFFISCTVVIKNVYKQKIANPCFTIGEGEGVETKS